MKWPGNLRDARAFCNCDIQKRFSNGKFKVFYKELLPEEERMPKQLLGAPAYSLLPYVMKMLNHCTSKEEAIFNQIMSSTRNQIESTFGKLKATTMFIIFRDFFMVEQIFLSPQVKRSVINYNKMVYMSYLMSCRTT